MSGIDFYLGFVTIWAVSATFVAMKFAKSSCDLSLWNQRLREVVRIRRVVMPESILHRLKRRECWN
jgi:hypothetical protein